MRSLCLLVGLAPGLARADLPPRPAGDPIALPGGPGAIKMDYLAVDGAGQRVWVPAGNTGRLDVIDAATGKVTAVAGFPHGDKGGPSSATVGDGVVFVGNRADGKVCAVDEKTLAIGACVQLASSPDGIAWVAPTREVWVTTPRDRSLTVIDASRSGALTVKTILKLDGEPEGYAVDAARGLFYTNLEDGDATLAFDVRGKKQVARWQPGCGKKGPRGLALDGERRFLLVACSDGAVALNAGLDGKVLGRISTGGGVDNIDYFAPRHLLYLASGGDGKLTFVSVGAHGELAAIGSAPTAPGSRVVVRDGTGRAYVADSAGGRILRFSPPRN